VSVVYIEHTDAFFETVAILSNTKAAATMPVAIPV
jgi:hypothetical protein